MRKNTEISERIGQVIDFLGVSKNVFAEKLGYDRSQTIYDIVNGKSKPSFDFLNRLYNSEYSEQIDPQWLLTGKGEMLKNSNVTKPEKEDVSNTITDNKDYTIQLLMQENKSLKSRINDLESIIDNKNSIIQLEKEQINILKAIINEADNVSNNIKNVS